MTFSTFPPNSSRVQRVGSFHELVKTPFANGINALCWERALPGDFAEVVSALRTSEDIATLDEARLRALSVSAAGKAAIEFMLEDLQRLQDRGLDPALNCINGYPRDEEPGPVPTDVFSFHADSAPVEADTWLCTYFGLPSEGILNEAARRRIDIPETRAELLKLYGGTDDAGFREFLSENSFGVGNLWRIATDWPGSPVPPCIHRAPTTLPGQARLLLIS
jgi:hypothetical protein